MNLIELTGDLYLVKKKIVLPSTKDYKQSEEGVVQRSNAYLL